MTSRACTFQVPTCGVSRLLIAYDTLRRLDSESHSKELQANIVGHLLRRAHAEGSGELRGGALDHISFVHAEYWMLEKTLVAYFQLMDAVPSSQEVAFLVLLARDAEHPTPLDRLWFNI